MKRLVLLATVLLLLSGSTLSCAPLLNSNEITRLQGEMETLKTSLASTQEEIAIYKKLLSQAQGQNELLEWKVEGMLETNTGGCEAETPVCTTLSPSASYCASPYYISPCPSQLCPLDLYPPSPCPPWPYPPQPCPPPPCPPDPCPPQPHPPLKEQPSSASSHTLIQTALENAQPSGLNRPTLASAKVGGLSPRILTVNKELYLK